MMSLEELDRLWADEGNWTVLGLYRCRQDPRIIVPKKIRGLGWTFNIAHAGTIKGMSIFVLMIILAIVPPLFVCWSGLDDLLSIAGSVIVSIVLLCAAGHYFATRTE